MSSSETLSGLLRRWWWIAAAFILVYGQILFGLVSEWWANEDYAHGLLTPFAVAYLIYERRRNLFAIPRKPTISGLFVMLASQVVLLVGFLGAEFFLQRSSMIVFLAGLIIFFRGWHAFSRSLFALILFLLAVPLPAILFDSIAFPLQLLASSLAETGLEMMRVPVYRSGNVLELPGRLFLNVAEACSGIRSLISLIALTTWTAMLGRCRNLDWWKRGIFIVSSVPIALSANAFRVVGTALLAHKFGMNTAEGFLHASSGWLVFMLAFVMALSLFVFMNQFLRVFEKARV